MKTVVRLIPIFLALFGAAAHAEKMDVETHTLVIEKLERVVSQMKPSDQTRVGIMGRLADLYAERARLASMAESDKGCEGCLGSANDRKKAITYYRQAFEKMDSERQERMLVQMAHLHELNNEPRQAEKLYQDVTKNPRRYSSSLVGASYAGLGEIAYREAQFQKALGFYQKALKIKDTPKRGFVTYRTAWCHLNLGHNARATQIIIGLLESPELLVNGREDGQMDKSFHADVARDLATFLARGNVGPAEVQKLISYSPEHAVKSNVHYLATETERVGKKTSALIVWQEFLKFQATPFDRLEVQVRVAQIQYDLGRNHQAVKDLKKATQMWRKDGCDNKDECDTLRVRLRNLVTEWNKAEKKKPTMNLLNAYGHYVNLFTEDLEMHYWAAQLARELSQWRTAIEYYNRASIIAAHQLRGKQKNPEVQKIFEGSLLGQIEVAEITRNLDLREQAYDHYLRINSDGVKALEVRYQRAQVYYEKKQYRKAAEHFTAIALVNDKSQTELRKKSADLALDALALEKEEVLIEKWALEFAKLFPKHDTEYLLVARRAVINQTAKVANDKSSSERDFEKALTKINTVNLKGASQNEQVAYFKNKILIAEKAKDLVAVDRAADGLLSIKGLTKEDREFAMTRKVWVAELALDFSKAFKIARHMDMPELSEDEKLLRLGLLAELAGSNPRPYYHQYIQKTRNARKANIVRIRMIKASPNPWAELERNLGPLSATPDLMTGVALELFSKKRDIRRAERVLTVRGAQLTPAGQNLFRLLFFRDYDRMFRKIAGHRLRTQSNYLVQVSLKQRLSLLADAEALAAEAVKSRDWTLQLLTLDILARENERLHREVLALPAAAGLTKAQKAEYLRLLAQQAQPYQNKAREIRVRMNAFWDNDKAIKSLIGDYKKSNKDLARLVAEEIAYLKRIAPDSVRRKFESALDDNDFPSREELLVARKDLRQDPFDLRKTRKLKELETEAGGETMAAYLEVRMEKMEKDPQ